MAESRKRTKHGSIVSSLYTDLNYNFYLIYGGFFFSLVAVPVQMPSLTSIATGPISVSSLLEIVADDLHKLNTNLKAVSSLINFYGLSFSDFYWSLDCIFFF